MSALPALTAAAARAQTAPTGERQRLPLVDATPRDVTLSSAVVMDLPRLADNGNSVNLSFHVDPPAGRRVAKVEVLAPRNPRALVVQLRPGPALGGVAFQTRIRLAATQTIWTVATLDDGQRLAAKSDIVVTVSSCFDGT